MSPTRCRRDPFSLCDDTRGTVMTEYVIILVTLTLVCTLSMAGLGEPLVSMFRGQKGWVLLPFP